jgi:hypothetical protein
VRPERRLVGVAQVRRAAGERVHEHAAERVDVRARVDALAADLLGRDEAERPDPAAGPAEARAGRGLALGQAEVREVGVVLGAEQDVRGLDVAVHEPVRVRGVERAADLADDVGRPLGIDEQHALTLARVVHGNDVRVLDRGRRLGLGDEARAKLRVVGECRGDDLQRDGAVEVQVDRAIDDTHPAAPGEPLDAVVDEDVTWRELRHASQTLPTCAQPLASRLR